MSLDARLSRWSRPLAWGFLLGGAILVLVLLLAPPAAGFVAPLSYRLLYVHVPSAWAAYLAFLVTSAMSLAHVLDPRPGRDRVAAASAEVGTLFATVALVTGLAWARVEFVAYDPVTDPKLVTLVVLLLAYLGYLALRRGVDDRETRARVSGVFGVAAFLAVPLSYLASRVSVHPDFTAPGESLDPALGRFLLASLLAFTLAYLGLLAARVRLARLQHDVEDLRLEQGGDAPW